MVDELGSNYREIAETHCSWLVLSVGILVTTSVLGVIIGPELPKSLLQRLLLTLVTAVASVLAIAFSVLFISTQIASERYSPKFTVSFVNDPIVKSSFGLGIFSIVANLSTLTVSSSLYRVLEAEPQGGLSMILWFVGGLLLGLNVVFFILLYPFIRLILIQTTPENILNQFKRQYDAIRYRKEAEDAEKVSNHPMQPVYDFARNAMKRGDYNAAISAVETLYQMPNNLLPKIVQAEEVDVESLFDPVLNEYGRSLIDQADDSGFSDAVATASEGMVQLGSTSISSGNKGIYDEVFSSAYSLFEDAAQFSEETNQVIVECCNNLYAAAAVDPETLEECIPRQAQLISIVAKRGSVTQFKTCLEEAKNAHNTYISTSDSSESEIRFEEVLLGYKEKKPAWERADEEDSSLLLDCTFLLMQTTGEVLNLCDDTNPPGLVYEVWEAAIEETYAQGLDIHLEHLIRRYIELAVYTELNHQSGLSAKNRILGIVTDDNFKESALASCNSIIDENRSTSDLEEFRFLEQELPTIWYPLAMTEYPNEFVAKVEQVKDQMENS